MVGSRAAEGPQFATTGNPEETPIAHPSSRFLPSVARRARPPVRPAIRNPDVAPRRMRAATGTRDPK